MTDFPYIIAASRSRLVIMAAFSILWASLLAQAFLIDHSRDLKMMIFPSAVWVLATVSAFINRTVFTERGVDQRMLLRGRQSIDYTDIRSIKLSGWGGVKAAYLYANDGRQIVIMGNAGQISLAESIMRSRMSPQA